VTLPAAGCDLLRQAVRYALASAGMVSPQQLARSTPCTGWTLAMLLSHLSDSLDALTEGLVRGRVDMLPSPGNELPAEPFGMRVRCAALLAVLPARPSDRVIAIGDCGLPDNVLACTGAIEVAVHGWDISAACGRPQPIPGDLASALLDAARVLLPANARDGLFAQALPPPSPATPGDRLLAFLGRQRSRLTPDLGS
jgi:uncharacterized protein (TIGR03086 family)